MEKHLILGGARSGKSSLAESKAKQEAALESKTLHYVATAIAFDDEMKDRIAHHQKTRGVEWCEHECSVALPELLATFTSEDSVLVDCLTLWLNNVIFELGSELDSDRIQQSVQELVKVVERSPASLYFVSNEVGLGVIPLGEVSRVFVDHAGWMNQALAKVCSNVTLVAAGLPLTLKSA